MICSPFLMRKKDMEGSKHQNIEHILEFSVYEQIVSLNIDMHKIKSIRF